MTDIRDARCWLTAFLIGGLFACGPDGTGPGGVPSASILRVADIANNGNGSDLFIAFVSAADESTVDHYRILVVEESSARAFDAAAASSVQSVSYTTVSTGMGTVETNLSATATDVTGSPIAEGVPYVVFVLVIGANGDNQLSNGSFTITLDRTNLVLTLTDEIQAGSGGMAVDADGNIYAADFGTALSGAPGTRVYKITPTGDVSTFATGLSGASGNAFDSHGNLFQSNIAGDRVSMISPSGQVTTFVTEGIQNPVGIAIDDQDNLYVANCGDNTIRFVTSDGTSTHFAGGTLFSCPNGIALASDDNLYVANFDNGNIIKVEPDGSTSLFVQIPGNNNGHITFANGVLYVVARSAHQIYELALDGELTLLAGSGQRGLFDGAALDARLSLTNDIAASPDGQTLYFNDVVNLTGTDIISPVVIRRLVLVN